ARAQLSISSKKALSHRSRGYLMVDLSSITDLSMLEAMDKQELAKVVKETIAGNEKQLKELDRLKDELLADISEGRDILKKLGLE
ncbi:hypothetical protein, partial [Psychrobacter celer]|uniref:hypothetical protein n=2 Tax=Psychrobacter celer TaxID=306572 RepID=UPI003FD6B84F